jgi:hypothetical protein
MFSSINYIYLDLKNIVNIITWIKKRIAQNNTHYINAKTIKKEFKAINILKELFQIMIITKFILFVIFVIKKLDKIVIPWHVHCVIIMFVQHAWVKFYDLYMKYMCVLYNLWKK